MSKVTRRFVVIAAAVAIVAALAVPSLVSAQMREFGGRIDKISKKKMIVDNRMGDKVSFIPADEMVVEGEGKKEWKDLKKGNWVKVSWKFMDKPRKAYKVVVTPPKEEEGEDE
jgi:hypothetical protein